MHTTKIWNKPTKSTIVYGFFSFAVEVVKRNIGEWLIINMPEDTGNNLLFRLVLLLFIFHGNLCKTFGCTNTFNARDFQVFFFILHSTWLPAYWLDKIQILNHRKKCKKISFFYANQRQNETNIKHMALPSAG